jgi:hypothetical protein
LMVILVGHKQQRILKFKYKKLDYKIIISIWLTT